MNRFCVFQLPCLPEQHTERDKLKFPVTVFKDSKLESIIKGEKSQQERPAADALVFVYKGGSYESFAIKEQRVRDFVAAESEGSYPLLK